MPEEKKNNLSQISDEALDALLAQWAEAEIAPPAGFHEKTMGTGCAAWKQQRKNRMAN